jgi:hypothetical protein
MRSSIYSVSCGLSAARAPGTTSTGTGTKTQTGPDQTGPAQDRHRPARVVLWRYFESSYQKRHKTTRAGRFRSCADGADRPQETL